MQARNASARLIRIVTFNLSVTPSVKLTVNSAIFGTLIFLFFCSDWYSVLVFTTTFSGAENCRWFTSKGVIKGTVWKPSSAEASLVFLSLRLLPSFTILIFLFPHDDEKLSVSVQAVRRGAEPSALRGAECRQRSYNDGLWQLVKPSGAPIAAHSSCGTRYLALLYPDRLYKLALCCPNTRKRKVHRNSIYWPSSRENRRTMLPKYRHLAWLGLILKVGTVGFIVMTKKVKA